MYQLTYDSKILFDPYMQSTAITDAKYTGKSNSVSYLDFSIAPNHPLYNTIEKDKGLVEFYSDNVLKFRGKINEIEIDNYGYKNVSCNSVLQYLNHTRVRSYSTVPGDADITAPTSVEGYFQWLIDQHNLHVKDVSERFEVGVNQGSALDKNDYILRSNDNYPTTLNEINDKILDNLGGYLFVEYKDDRNILNLYADVHSTNSQIIDFGSNILSISYKENDDELYTVVIPRGGTPEKKEGDTKDPKPINIKNLPDNTFDTDSDIVKSGDCVYSLSATKRYGYREYYYSNNDILEPSNLLKAAVIQLKFQMSPKVTIETKAIDLSIAYPGYEQLNIGDACRVRSARHNLDDYFMLSEMELDLNNPSQTTYTFGDEYVSLVGRQSNYLKQINSSIDRNYEDVNTAMSYGKAAAKLADTANKTADAANNTAVKANDKAQKATEDAFNANTTANNAQNTADNASSKASEAKDTADQAQNAADKASLKAAEAKTTADGKNKVFTQTEEPEHTGLTNGDLWQKLDSSGHISSVNVWNGTKFTAYSLVADSLLVPGSINGSVLIQDGTIEAKNIKIGNGEILTELLKARKIVTDDVEAGQFKGYVFTGAIFQSSEAENTGIKLNSNSLQMWDSAHNQTVYLDGEGKSNVLTGTFQTRMSGHRLRISPDFKASIVGGTETFVGDGLEFLAYKGSAAYYRHPTISSLVQSNQVGEMGELDLWSGRVAKHDPAALLQLQSKPREMGGTGSDGVTSKVFATANTDYDEPDASKKSIASLTLSGDSQNGSNVWLEAADGGGSVGIGANIHTRYVYLGGYLGGITNRQTFQSICWKIYDNTSLAAYATIPQTTWSWTPAKFGRYYGVCNSDLNWGSIFMHVCNTGGAGTIQVMGYNAGNATYNGAIFVDAIAWLAE